MVNSDPPPGPAKAGGAADKLLAWRAPVETEINDLHLELAAFNDRIKELEKLGHKGHALEVLKRQALRMASQIDELRSLLVQPRPPTNNRKPK